MFEDMAPIICYFKIFWAFAYIKAEGTSELGVILLKNGSNIYDDELVQTSLLVDVEPFDFIYDEKKSVLFLQTKYFSESIMRVSLGGDTHPRTFVEYVYETKSIQHDFWLGNIYWIQSNLVEVCSSTGQYRKTLYWKNLSGINAMVLDPLNGLIFWSVEGKSPKIERASMDGNESSRVAIVTKNISNPFGLTLDPNQERLYWSDLDTKVIERCTYDGGRREVLKQSRVQTPGDLVFHQERVYWIEELAHTVNVLDLRTNESRTVSSLPKDLLYQYVHNKWSRRPVHYKHFRMKIYDTSRSYRGDNQTESCDQLTLTSSVWPFYTCVCAANFHMTRDGYCEENNDSPEVMICSTYGLSTCSNNTRTDLYSDKKKVDDFMFLEDQSDVMFTHSRDVFISLMNNISALRASIALPVTFVAWYLEYDWIGRNIYVVSNTFYTGDILLMKIISENEVIFGVFKIEPTQVIGFAIDPTVRIAFFAYKWSVNRIAMDGDEKTRKELLKIGSGKLDFRIGLDVEYKIIYWVRYRFDQYRHNEVQRCTYEGEILDPPVKKLFTMKIAISGKYKISSEFTDGYNVLVTQCRKDYDGDCEVLCELSGTDVPRIRVYPEKRDYIDNFYNPCDVNNGNCSDFCLVTYLAPYFRCTCKYRYRLQTDNRTCSIHPCELNNGECSMMCVKLDQLNYKCTCKDGFQLQDDGKTCHGDMGVILIEGIHNGWQQVDLVNETRLRTYVGTVVNVVGFDPINYDLYWSTPKVTQNGKFVIWHSKMDASEKRLFLQDISTSVSGIEVDWLISNLYWSTYASFWRTDFKAFSRSKVELSEIEDALQRKPLIPRDENSYDYLKIVTLHLDVFSGNLFWISTTTFHENEHLYVMHITRMEINIFDKGIMGRFLFSLKDFITSAGETNIGVSSLHNKILYLTYATYGNSHAYNMSICGTDGLGEKEYGINIKMFSDITTIGDDFYFWASDKIKVNAVNYSLEFIEKSNDLAGNNFLIAANITNKGSPKREEQCEDYRKCWGMTNALICLRSGQICDGVSDCYEAHDEHFCSVCESTCNITTVQLSCYPDNTLRSRSYNDDLNVFLDWESHHLSKIISLEDLLIHDCSIAIKMKSDTFGHIEFLKVHNLYNLHKTRQLIISNFLNDLSHVEKLDLFGTPLLIEIKPETLSMFQNLKHFSLQQSHVTHLPKGIFNGTGLLESIRVVENYGLSSLDEECFMGLTLLKDLSLTNAKLPVLSGKLFQDLDILIQLNLSSNGINILGMGIFDNLEDLKILDLRGNDISLTSNIFIHTNVLEMIYCESFTLCCIKPISVSDANCTASRDDISSCSNLIENRVLAIFLWVFGLMAFFGNLSVLIYRGLIDKSMFTKSYFIFIYNLGIADMVMALYMLIIAIHDAMYDGIYVWNDYTWKRSNLCLFSGILSIISSESSMIFVCFITIERYLCVKFTFGNIKISKRHALFICAVVWCVAIGLALLPMFSFPEFFTKSGVCIGIPLTKNRDSGLGYSLFLFLGLNFLFCAVIPFGQYFILDEVRKSSKLVQSSQTGRNMAVAKKLAVVVLTDCLCWIPVGVLVILSLTGVSTPREIYAWVIIFVLPINAAVNPYLYTLTDIDKNKMKRFFNIKGN